MKRAGLATILVLTVLETERQREGDVYLNVCLNGAHWWLGPRATSLAHTMHVAMQAYRGA